jgi:hypothetical protein
MISSFRISRSVARRTPQRSDRFEQRQKDKGQSSDSDSTQVDDVISRIPEIWRKAKNAKNSLAPINKIPPETLAQVAAFIEPGRQLVDTTAVCQHWRATLLSFPRLWNTVRCSNQRQFDAYLERSKSVPLKVQLQNLYPRLLGSLSPHASRLVVLAIWVNRSSDFSRIAQYLPNPIPTLHKFGITSFGSDHLNLPHGIGNDHFTHVKELRLEDISSFRAPRAFPHVTKLTWYVGPGRGGPVELPGLLATLEQLPALEQVDLVFRTSQDTAIDWSPRVVTLPNVQRMSLCRSGDWKVGVPPILDFLILPNLTSLAVDEVSRLPRAFRTLPVASFGERLPNLAELPEMEVRMCGEIGRVGFRSPSQAVLEYRAIARPLGEKTYRRDRRRWGGLPLHSVRRLTATLDRRAKGVEDVWLIRLLHDLSSLEYLELEGYCGGTLRRLRQLMMGKDIHLGIETLTVRSGPSEIRQAMRLKDVADGLGLGINVTCIPDQSSMNCPDGLSGGWDLGDEDESDEE